MYKCLLLLITIVVSSSLFAQPKEFEGIVNYNVEVRSKAPGITDKVMRTMLATGDNMTVWIKQGNYKQSTSAVELYYITAKQRVYYKFKNIDTLYFLDYSSDTTAVTNSSILPDEQRVANYDCKTFLIRTSGATKKYVYAPSLYSNPEYDKNNKLGNYDVFIKATSSVWLNYTEETETYRSNTTATKVEERKIDNSIFNLPSLPEKKFSVETVFKMPEFSRSGGWVKYLETNANSALGAKYIKIPKGEKNATQTVIVSFMVTENGAVENVKVENPKEVHPKLAEEALRLVTYSGKWKPATIYGEKISNYLKQLITFQVTK
jgi:hypothetical protein